MNKVSSSSSVYWHSNLVTFSDWLRMLAHIDTGNRKFDTQCWSARLGTRMRGTSFWSTLGYSSPQCSLSKECEC